MLMEIQEQKMVSGCKNARFQHFFLILKTQMNRYFRIKMTVRIHMRMLTFFLFPQMELSKV